MTRAQGAITSVPGLAGLGTHHPGGKVRLSRDGPVGYAPTATPVLATGSAD